MPLAISTDRVEDDVRWQIAGHKQRNIEGDKSEVKGSATKLSQLSDKISELIVLDAILKSEPFAKTLVLRKDKNE